MAFRRGDSPPCSPETLAAFYDTYGEKLYAYALSLLDSITDAEDAVQDVFARLHEHRNQPRNPAGYLYQAVRNAAYSRLRKRRVRFLAAKTLERETHFLHAHDPSRPPEERDRIEAGLRSLPPKQRELIVLKIYQGMTFEEIGTILNISPNTAASRYRYAIDKLRQWFANEEF